MQGAYREVSHLAIFTILRLNKFPCFGHANQTNKGFVGAAFSTQGTQQTAYKNFHRET
jgi:hypothetical protein